MRIRTSDGPAEGELNMRIFVTGATGFIGSAIVQELVGAGYQVLGLALIGVARKKGVSAHVGDGLNRWPAVHRLDAAHLYRLVLEKGSAGARYHGVADEGVPVRDIAEVIGRRLNVPVVAKPREQAADHFGWIGHFFGMDGLASSAQTRERLGWRPTQPSLIPDVDRPSYFAE
jgi:nucleoside-diphosphate-sugar epimerase